MSASPELSDVGIPPEGLKRVLEGFFARFLPDDEVPEAIEETLRDVRYRQDADLADVFTWAHLVLGSRARVGPREEFNALVDDVGLERREAAGLVGVPNLEAVRDIDTEAGIGPWRTVDDAPAEVPDAVPAARSGADDASIASAADEAPPAGDAGTDPVPEPEDDPWALEPLPTAPMDPADALDPEREPAWHITREGWLSAESVGSDLRDQFATEDLDDAPWNRARRTAVGVAAAAAGVGVIAAVAVF